LKLLIYSICGTFGDDFNLAIWLKLLIKIKMLFLRWLYESNGTTANLLNKCLPIFIGCLMATLVKLYMVWVELYFVSDNYVKPLLV